LTVYRSLVHIYVQAVDDMTGRTVASAATTETAVKAGLTGTARGSNKAGAQMVGKAIAERLIAMGITRVVFDRNGYLYHGRVRAVADAAREAGLEF
jgi:large subunit ribosomal protein L18